MTARETIRELAEIVGFMTLTVAAGILTLTILYGVAASFGQPAPWQVEAVEEAP